MKSEKKLIEFADFIITLTVRPKKRAKSSRSCSTAMISEISQPMTRSARVHPVPLPNLSWRAFVDKKVGIMSSK